MQGWVVLIKTYNQRANYLKVAYGTIKYNRIIKYRRLVWETSDKVLDGRPREGPREHLLLSDDRVEFYRFPTVDPRKVRLKRSVAVKIKKQRFSRSKL